MTSYGREWPLGLFNVEIADLLCGTPDMDILICHSVLKAKMNERSLV
jgi:hypothetical protein